MQQYQQKRIQTDQAGSSRMKLEGQRWLIPSHSDTHFLQCCLPGTEQFLKLCSAWLVMLKEAETTGKKAAGESKLFGRFLMYPFHMSDVMLLNSCCVFFFQRWPGSCMQETAVFSKSGVWRTRYWFLTVSTLEPSPSQFSGSTRQFLTHLKMPYCYHTS